MIEKLDIEGVHLSVDENTKRYVTRKIGHLDKYLPKHARESAWGEVLLKDSKEKTNNYICEINLYLPKEIINVKEATTNIFASIDIVETKLKHRIEKYKDLHGSVKHTRHLIEKLRKKADQNP
jgi:ribosomal subunit interface protein